MSKYGESKLHQACSEIAEEFIAQLEAIQNSDAQWTAPWSTSDQRPVNYLTTVPYRGFNVIRLAMTQVRHGYRYPYWLTFKQMMAVAAKIGVPLSNAGTKGTLTVHYGRQFKKGWRKHGSSMAIDTNGSVAPIDKATYFGVNVFYLYNVDQITGWPEGTFEDPEPKPEVPFTNERCLAWQEAARGKIPPILNSSQAAYALEPDVVYMPNLNEFITDQPEENWWATALHEYVHSTRHQDRVGRPKGLTTKDYALEELVAEFGASFLTGFFDFKSDLQHREYIAGYAKAIRNDPTQMWHCAKAADQAATWLLEAGGLAWPNPLKQEEQQAA